MNKTVTVSLFADIIFTPDMLKLRRPPQSSATKDHDPSALQNVLVHKFFSSATFSAGVMVLLPDTVKGPHTVEEDTLVNMTFKYYIHKVAVCLHFHSSHAVFRQNL